MISDTANRVVMLLVLSLAGGLGRSELHSQYYQTPPVMGFYETFSNAQTSKSPLRKYPIHPMEMRTNHHTQALEILHIRGLRAFQYPRTLGPNSYHGASYITFSTCPKSVRKRAHYITQHAANRPSTAQRNQLQLGHQPVRRQFSLFFAANFPCLHRATVAFAAPSHAAPAEDALPACTGEGSADSVDHAANGWDRFAWTGRERSCVYLPPSAVTSLS